MFAYLINSRIYFSIALLLILLTFIYFSELRRALESTEGGVFLSSLAEAMQVEDPLVSYAPQHDVITETMKKSILTLQRHVIQSPQELFSLAAGSNDYLDKDSAIGLIIAILLFTTSISVTEDALSEVTSMEFIELVSTVFDSISATINVETFIAIVDGCRFGRGQIEGPPMFVRLCNALLSTVIEGAEKRRKLEETVISLSGAVEGKHARALADQEEINASLSDELAQVTSSSSAENDALRRQVLHLRDKIYCAQAETEHFKKESGRQPIADTKREKDDFQALERSHKNLEVEFNKIIEENESNKRKIADAQTEITRLDNLVMEMKEMRQDLQGQLETAAESNTQLKFALDAKNREVDCLNFTLENPIRESISLTSSSNGLDLDQELKKVGHRRDSWRRASQRASHIFSHQNRLIVPTPDESNTKPSGGRMPRQVSDVVEAGDEIQVNSVQKRGKLEGRSRKQVTVRTETVITKTKIGPKGEISVQPIDTRVEIQNL